MLILPPPYFGLHLLLPTHLLHSLSPISLSIFLSFFNGLEVRATWNEKTTFSSSILENRINALQVGASTIFNCKGTLWMPFLFFLDLKSRFLFILFYFSCHIISLYLQYYGVWGDSPLFSLSMTNASAQ